MPPPLNSVARIAAVVVTYQPSEEVAENVRRLRAQTPDVVVVDNGSGPAAGRVLAEWGRRPGIHVIRNTENLGIAAALNQGIRYAIKKGAQWIATFDQDSTVPDGFFEGMLSACDAFPQARQVALVSPVHCYREDEVTSPPSMACDPVHTVIPVAMTSGSVIRAAAFCVVGFYDEALFIDYVDFDFCLRLRAAGYQLLRANCVRLQHQLGSPELHSMLGMRISIKSHTAWRRYYIMRNRVLMYRRYGLRFPGWCMHDLGWLLLDLGKIVVFERQKIAKLRHVITGISHGLTGRTGRLSESTS